MTIEQTTITKIKADEGKVLRRKANGAIYGKELSLGYNYYDTGVGLAEPRLDTPEDFDEIDAPADYVSFTVDQVDRLKRIARLVADERDNIDRLNLTDAQSLEVMDWFPAWEPGKALTAGQKVTYGGKFWKVVQAHTTQEGWEPSLGTSSLFEEVTADETAGTVDNPIPYNGNMTLESGKHYSQDGTVYLCIRDSVAAVYNPLAELVGIYVYRID